MTFLSSAAPLAAYRAGQSDDALEIARQVLAQDPDAAEAHLCVALIMLRRNDVTATIASLRKCVRSRSGEWVLERLRADFARAGTPGLQRDMVFGLGAFFRANLGAVGRALAPDQRRAAHDYLNVVGTSYVRSFGGNPAFFPLFIGMGPSTLLLTDELAAVTRRKFHENLKRVDPARHTVLVLNGDTYYHATNLVKTRASDSPGATAEDFAIMDRVAERHAAILSDARAMISGQVLLLGPTPSYSPLMDQLSGRLAPRLAEVCAAEGVGFLDWWAELADPVTQHLRAEYSANAYPQDVHFSLSTTELFMRLLKDRGLFGPEVDVSATFEWSHVFECDIDKSDRTRIWCEPGVSPNNAFKSHKIASAHLGARGAELLACFAGEAPDQTFAMVNVRDGYLPVAVPQQLHSGCLALTDTRANQQVAQVVLDFYGRPDIRLLKFDEAALQEVDGRPFSNLVLVIHPDTAEEDERRCNEVLRRIGPCRTVVVMTPLPDRLDRLQMPGRWIAAKLTISNRHIPAVWHDYTVAIAR